MFFRKFLSFFLKDKKKSKASIPSKASQEMVNANDDKNPLSQPKLEQKSYSIEGQSLADCDIQEKVDFNEQEIPLDEVNRLQSLASRAYKESGASFYGELFPDKPLYKPRSSRHNRRVFITPSLSDEFFELGVNNLRYVKSGDYLRVKKNGIFNCSNEFICCFDTESEQLKYRDRLKVENVFEATNTAPAYLKVEVLGFEPILTDYVELTRKNHKTHDGQNILAIARNLESKISFGYQLSLVADSDTYYVVLYFGSIERATDIDFGVNGQGTDGCILLGTVQKQFISESTHTQMRALTDYDDLPHPYLKYLGRDSKLELLVKEGKLHLYVFDSRTLIKPPINASSKSGSQSEYIKHHDYERLDNGKYRCIHTEEIFVSSWFFGKKHSVKLNDVNILRAAQADGIRHDKKCRVEFESARQVWGDYVYMYPEKWLEQQSSRLW